MHVRDEILVDLENLFCSLLFCVWFGCNKEHMMVIKSDEIIWQASCDGFDDGVSVVLELWCCDVCNISQVSLSPRRLAYLASRQGLGADSKVHVVTFFVFSFLGGVDLHASWLAHVY